ncbi:MAG: hypothetical protein QW379_07055 [Thermoplasmata archaeon]
MALRVYLLPMLTREGLARLTFPAPGGTTTGRTGSASSSDRPSHRLPFAIDSSELEALALGIRAAGVDLIPLPPRPLLPEMYNPVRRQYQCSHILRFARELLEGLGGFQSRLLVLTDADVYEPGMSFTGGMAELGGRLSLVSLARLQSGDRERMVSRAVKECLHELGHNLGLEHCRRRECVMFLSRTLADSDLKSASFCPACRAILGRALMS